MVSLYQAPSLHLKFEADFSQVFARFFVAEGIGNSLEVECSIDHWTQAHRIDSPDHLLLMTAIANDESLQLHLLQKQRGDRYLYAASGERANQCDVPTNAHGRNRLWQGAWPPNLDDVIDATPGRPLAYGVTPLRLSLVVYGVVGTERPDTLELRIGRGSGDDPGSHPLGELEREDGDSAGAKDEDGIPSLQAAIDHQCAPSGQSGSSERRTFRMTESAW